MDQQFLLFGSFRVILKQISHLFVVELQEGAVDLDMFPPLHNQPVEEKVDGSGNESCVILVLLYTSEKSGLLPAFLFLC
jgi:hypothetical protein